MAPPDGKTSPPKPSVSLVAALMVGLLCSFLASLVWEVAPLVRTLPLDFDVHSMDYVPHEIVAPIVAQPWKLKLVARLMVSSPLGDFLARRLLSKNNVPALVDFAEEIMKEARWNNHHKDLVEDSASLPITGSEWIVGSPPLVRLNREEYDWHVEAASRLEFPRGIPSERQSPKFNSVYDYYKAYESGKTTPTKVLARLLDFIESTHSALRFVEFLDETGAPQEAAWASTERWKNGTPLSLWDGVPIMLKSQVAIKGIKWTGGTPAESADVAIYDDLLVKRLRQAGAIVVASTVMHEKGVQPTGYNPWYQGPNNPYGLNRFSGGSSSGSVVAVATNCVPMAVGFDGGGSIRIPAAWSGTVGLAGGFSRIPFTNGEEALYTVVKSGFLTTTVADSLEAYLLLGKPVSAEEGGESHVYTHIYAGNHHPPPPPHTTARWKDQQRPIRIGIFQDWNQHRASETNAGTTGKDDAMYKHLVETVDALVNAGAEDGQTIEVVPVAIPHMNLQQLTHGTLITAMFAFSNLREVYRGQNRIETPDPYDDFQPATQIQIKLGSQITAFEILACLRIRNFALSHWRRIFRECDVMLTPTIPMTALRRPSGSDVLGQSNTGLYYQMLRFIWPGNFIGLPGLAVPVGTDTDGLPTSVQVLCAQWHEADCLEMGRLIENLRQAHRPVPPAEFYVDLLAE